MKRFHAFIMLLALTSATFVGCHPGRNVTKGVLGGGTGVGGTVVKTVATVVGLILLSKLIKSVMTTVTGGKAFENLAQDENFKNKFNEDTKLNSFAKNDVLKAALQVLVSQHYQIPLTTVVNNYAGLNTVGDLATFVGQNGSAKVLTGIK
ncbi:MAG TPA: hypothetical protein VMY77_00600 [Chitinophagaceae bacterium]|nr:hypothetical protein [Chitinophagaceae bacterium]